METRRTLPDGAYEALKGLKAQAGAAMMLLPGDNKAEGRKALKAAHAQMSANDEWVKKIFKAIMNGDGKTTMDSADEEWLEKTFARPAI
ncbi:hypothetical protein RYA05_00755 [Pseudomonas syringae pv. actinidiae]|nr:hypothetical protein [Pseudomonas syringae pv. actinidiae]